MKIGVMGTGGVGGYFGGMLARLGQDIHFVARGRHLRAIQEEGLQVVSGDGGFRVRVHATADPYDIGPVDLVLFSVKSYDTEEACHNAAPMIEEGTTILSLQNGIDNIEKIVSAFGEERVLGGTAYIESCIASPGVIVRSGKQSRIVFGELDGNETDRSRAILETFRGAGIETELTTDIWRTLWSKFLFICGVHGVSTLSRSTLGLVLACPETHDLLVGVMAEVEALARKKGVTLPPDVLEEAVALAESYDKCFKCSMLRDLEWRRPMELDSLNGMVARLGKEEDVPTPLNRAIYACLKLENRVILDRFWVSQVEGGLCENMF